MSDLGTSFAQSVQESTQVMVDGRNGLRPGMIPDTADALSGPREIRKKHCVTCSGQSQEQPSQISTNEDGTETETFDNGAMIQRDPATGQVLKYSGPTVTDGTGELKSAEQVKSDGVCWSQYRLDNHLNTIGPDGYENRVPYGILGDRTQVFGGFHDVQTSEAERQAFAAAGQDPVRAQQIMSHYQSAYVTSAIQGSWATLVDGPEAGAQAAKDSFAKAGFDVSGPADIPIRWSPR